MTSKAKGPHDQIKSRVIILIFGLTIALGANVLAWSIVGWVFVAYAVLRLLWKDIYKASHA